MKHDFHENIFKEVGFKLQKQKNCSKSYTNYQPISCIVIYTVSHAQIYKLLDLIKTNNYSNNCEFVLKVSQLGNFFAQQCINKQKECEVNTKKNPATKIWPGKYSNVTFVKRICVLFDSKTWIRVCGWKSVFLRFLLGHVWDAEPLISVFLWNLP